jgi:phosphatidylserine/phosphatidylglycerophosphate/cardiolipin synthase-like enzyme
MITTFRLKCRDALKYIRPELFRLAMIGMLIGICLISVTSLIVTSHYNSQFRVIYSLDRRQNDQEIIQLINDADKYVYFAIYFFTKNNIADALIRAKERGLVVWGITDALASEDSNKNIVDKLKSAGISIETQKHQEGIMHLKLLVTDKAYASGSYNWTAGATAVNDEVLEIGTNNSVREKYLTIMKKVLLANQ